MKGFVERETQLPKPYDAEWLAHYIAITVNYGKRLVSATVGENPTQLLIDMVDPTGPNGQRSFIIEVREVT